MKTFVLRLFLAANFSIFVSYSFAQPGTLDSSFGVNGKITSTFGLSSVSIRGFALQKDGKIVTTGTNFTANPNNAHDFLTARFLANGKIDSSFGDNGKVITHFDFGIGDAYGTRVVIQTDGKIIVGGYLYKTYIQSDHFVLVRFFPDGKVDSTFGSNGQVITYLPGEDYLDQLLLQSDGKIIAAGYCDGTAVVRYKVNGSLDSSFGINGSFILHGLESFSDAVLLSDGKILIGETQHIFVGEENSYSFFKLLRLKNNGIIDSTFGTNGIVTTQFPPNTDNVLSSLRSVNILSNGSILASGESYNQSDFISRIAICKFKNNGSIDSSFGNAGKILTTAGETTASVNVSVLQTDQKLITAGNILTRFKSDGSVDSSYGTNGKASNYIPTRYARLQDDQKLITINSPYTLTRYKTDPVTISLQKNISITEGNTGATIPALFKVVLNKPSATDVFVNYTTKNINAVAGSDYTAASGTVRIKAGKTKANIIVSVTGDNTREANERFALVLSNPVIAVLGTLDSATCTIRNDDASFALSSATKEEITTAGKIKIYPNPVKDVLTIEGLNASKKSVISIIGSTGLALSKTVTTGNLYAWNIKQLPAGTYFVKIETGGKTETLKFIKQ